MANTAHVYMDTCCFVEVAQNAPTPGRENDIWFIEQLLRAAQARDIILHTSILTVAECQFVVGRTEDETREIFDHVLTSGQVAKIINPTVFTGKLATKLFWQDKIALKGADLLHVASAIEKKCIEFVTFDGADKPRAKSPFKNAERLQKMGLRVVRPSQTQVLPAAYRQGRLAGVLPTAPATLIPADASATTSAHAEAASPTMN